MTDDELTEIKLSWVPRDVDEDAWGSDTTTIRQLIAVIREAWDELDALKSECSLRESAGVAFS